VADIGGTHARLARWTAASGLEAPLRLRNDDYGTPVELLEDWFRRFDEEPRRVVLALAMPIGAETLQLTNREWHFDPRELVGALRLQSLVIVNDFAAAAAGVDALAADDVTALNGEATPVIGTRLVLGPGTGLGTAAIVADDPPRVVPSEAGHMTFASAEAIANRVNAEGRRRWGRVSWERVLCGAGLAWLHRLQHGRDDRPEAIAQAAASGDARALETARLFARLLGEFAGDVCLAFQAMEGVYLCGGVLRGLRPVFDAPAFLAAFCAKGRFAAPLQRVPVHYAAAHELGMQGAARFLAGRCRMPSLEWHA
jgi:glucokinase